MSIKSTLLVLDYLELLKRSRLNEEASVARCFHPLGWRWQGQVLADCGFGFEAQFMNEELKKKIMGNDRAVCRLEATELK